MKTICIPHSGRTKYLHDCLYSLQKNDLEGWDILIGCEPNTVKPNHAFGVEGTTAQYLINGFQLGVGLNQFVAIWKAIEHGAQAVLLVEDDIVLSPDAVRLCNWYLAREEFRDPKFNAGIALCTKQSDPQGPGDILVTETWQGLLGQGYCFTRDMWFDFVMGNFWSAPPDRPWQAWDWSLAQIATHLKKKILRPKLSRSRHIGVTGVHGISEAWPDIISTSKNTEFAIMQG